MSNLDIGAVQKALREFARDRDWEQFHTPKNLAMAMAGEIGELCDIFQWLTDEESWNVMDAPERAASVRDELADVLNYLIRLADILAVDLDDAVWKKIRKNGEKYPVSRAKGSPAKYSELRARLDHTRPD